MLLGPAQHHVMLRATREQGTQVNSQLSLGVEVGGRSLSKVLGNDRRMLAGKWQDMFGSLKDLPDDSVEDTFEAGYGTNRRQRSQEATSVNKEKGLRFWAGAVERDREREMSRMWWLRVGRGRRGGIQADPGFCAPWRGRWWHLSLRQAWQEKECSLGKGPRGWAQCWTHEDSAVCGTFKGFV